MMKLPKTVSEWASPLPGEIALTLRLNLVKMRRVDGVPPFTTIN